MRRIGFDVVLGIAACAAQAANEAPAGAAERVGPPVAAVRPVEDVYFGTRVVDPYRWMEKPAGTELADWMRAQNDYTRATLDAPAVQRRQWLDRILALTSGAESSRFFAEAGGRYFYLSTAAAATKARLVSRAMAGGEPRVLLDVAAVGADRSIDFHSPSPRGRYASVTVSKAGAEDWAFRIVDAKDGKLLPDVVDRISQPFPAWAHDERGFYYSRMQDEAAIAGDRPNAAYENIRIYYHAVGTEAADDVAVFGPGVIAGVDLPAAGFADVQASRDGRWLIGTHVVGVRYNAKAMWARDLRTEPARWRKVADYDDEVSTIKLRGDTAYVIVSRNAPNGRVLAVDLVRGDVASAKVVVPESDIVISADVGSLVGARDALYLFGQRDGVGSIRRVDYDTHALAAVALPKPGAIGELAANDASDGFALGLYTPESSPLIWRYEPKQKRMTDTGLLAPDPADDGTLELLRTEVPSTGGVRVPVTLVHRKGLERDGGHPALVASYGAYGAIAPTWFIPGMTAWYERGGVYLFVHARGGGEKGSAWHEAARTVKKQATIDDVLAAARWLVAEGYTQPRHLAVAGKSAGGYPSGGAITQAPELFRAALLRVAVTDPLRIEQARGGESNTIEFGSVKQEDEFRVLYKIAPYTNVRDGVAYPAVLLETGINDPRVPPWQLAKMAARLQAATSAADRPILLRVDYAAGHGVGNDKRQNAELLADELSFLAWQLGMKPRADDEKAARRSRSAASATQMR